MIITSKPKPTSDPIVAPLSANKPKKRKPRTKKLPASGAEIVTTVVLPAPIPTLLDTLNGAKQGLVCGPAGSGKTHLIREQLKLNPGWGLLCATTGVAARLLGPDVPTINSALGFFDLESIQSHHKLRNNVARLRKNFERLIIDECSMLDAKIFEPIAEACEKEGMKLLLVGDFLQLAPIDRKKDTGPWIPPRWIFRSKHFEPFRANIMKLETQFRHTNKDFLEGMNHLRRGRGRAAIEPFRKAGVKFLENFEDFDYDFDGLTLTPTNQKKNKIDQHHYAKLTTEEVVFKTLRSGKQKAEWKENIQDEVSLKPGCRVMVLRNESDEGKLIWANGDMGRVLELVPETDTRRGYAVVERDDGAILNIKMAEDDDAVSITVFTDAGKKRQIIKEATGWVKWMPLRRAYALTFHKAQGLTLAKTQVDLLPPFAGKEAMTYVACSRARDPEGLTIYFNEEMLPTRCNMDKFCKEWI